MRLGGRGGVGGEGRDWHRLTCWVGGANRHMLHIPGYYHGVLRTALINYTANRRPESTVVRFRLSTWGRGRKLLGIDKATLLAPFRVYRSPFDECVSRAVGLKLSVEGVEWSIISLSALAPFRGYGTRLCRRSEYASPRATSCCWFFGGAVNSTVMQGTMLSRSSSLPQQTGREPDDGQFLFKKLVLLTALYTRPDR